MRLGGGALGTAGGGGRWARRSAAAGLLALLCACGPRVMNTIELMPSPTLHAAALLDPFEGVTAETFATRGRLFYATDRVPAGPGDAAAFYANARGQLLRTGIATVAIDPPVASWEELRRMTLTGAREGRHRLRVAEVAEIGPMPFSVTALMAEPPAPRAMEEAGRRFAAEVDAQLAASGNRDVFVFVPGYNLDFAYATLIAKELQHFLGYQGAFVTYNWAATPSRLAYFRDQEAAMATRRALRELIVHLSRHTRAHRIHLIGHSAGSRPAFEAAWQIALMPGPKPRMGRLILIGSDLDRGNFLQALGDGLLTEFSDVTLYQSQTDAALGLSRSVFGRERLGEAPRPGTVEPAAMERLAAIPNLHVIDVTGAPQAGAGNGHWYFQSSPWASSDLFLALLTDHGPAARGLVRGPGEALWRFPPDYPEVLKRIAARN